MAVKNAQYNTLIRCMSSILYEFNCVSKHTHTKFLYTFKEKWNEWD